MQTLSKTNIHFTQTLYSDPKLNKNFPNFMQYLHTFYIKVTADLCHFT